MNCNNICVSGERCLAERIEDMNGRIEFSELDKVDLLSSVFQSRREEFIEFNNNLPFGDEMKDLIDETNDPELKRDLECVGVFAWGSLECQNPQVSMTGRLGFVTEMTCAFDGVTKVIDLLNEEKSIGE